MLRIAPQLKPPASIAGLPTAADSSSVLGSKASKPSSSRAASDAAINLSRAASAASAAHEGSSSRGPIPISRSVSRPGTSSAAESGGGLGEALQAPPSFTDMEEVPGLPAAPPSKKAKQQATAVAGASSSRGPALQQRQQLLQQEQQSRFSATGPPALTPPRSPVASVRGQGAAAEEQAGSDPAAAGPYTAAASPQGPQSLAEVDADTIAFLFQGPSSNTAVELQWYYIDPDGLVQVCPHGCVELHHNPEGRLLW